MSSYDFSFDHQDQDCKCWYEFFGGNDIIIAHTYSMLSYTLHFFRYDNLHKYDLPYPEAIFDVDFYRQNPMPFVTLSQEIWPGVKYRYDEISYSAYICGWM